VYTDFTPFSNDGDDGGSDAFDASCHAIGGI
jgi:hypothetical protein